MLDLNTRWENAYRRSETVTVKEVPTRHAKRRVFMVKSESQPNTYYHVVVQQGVVTCSCPAGYHAMPCKHKAKVMREMGVMA